MQDYYLSVPVALLRLKHLSGKKVSLNLKLKSAYYIFASVAVPKPVK
jgi:hypothetical protein